MSEIVLGIDIGGTNTKMGLVNSQGKLLAFKTFPTKDPKDFDEYKVKLKEITDQLCKQAQVDYKNIIAVGVGAPNGNGTNGHIESPPNLKHWGSFDFVTPVSEILGKPTYLENDANVAAMGEKMWGQGQELEDFIVITLGTGIGTGVYTHNKLITGKHGLAGEGGHIIIEENGRACGCGGHGHLEVYGSVTGIKTTTKEVTDEELTFHEISDRYHQGDVKIKEVFDRTAKYLGLGLSQMGSLLCPQAFIIAGGVATIGEDFIKLIKVYYDQFIYPPFKGKTDILLSKISTKEGAVLGAAGLAFNKIKK